MQKSFYPKAEDLQAEWVLVDASDQTLGRVAAKIAHYLLGKHKPSFTPGVAVGDYVVVINAAHISVTGNKMEDKTYNHHSGFPGGIKTVTLAQQLVKHPDRPLRAAVWGMLPHNKVGRELIKRMKIYAGPDHPHAAQQPKAV